MTLDSGHFSIVIPAYNEHATLPAVLQGLQAVLAPMKNWEIIVIDDGSRDGTADLITPPVRLVKHPENRGHGAAVKTGLNAATGDTVIVFDADGQHDPEDVLRLLQARNEGNDLVVGSRKRLWRQHNGRGNIAVSLMASALSGIWVPDLTSGLRALSREKAFEFMKYYPNRFCFELTTTMCFALKKYKVKFVDIEPRLRKGGHSKIVAIWDGIRFCTIMCRLVFFLKPLRFIALVLLLALAVWMGTYL